VARSGAGATDEIRDAAGAALTRLAARADIQTLISEQDVQHEVAFSWRADDGSTLRAVVDAVVRRADGSVTLVEFKTGAPRDADTRQLQAYVDGVRRLLPETALDGRIIRLDS
jgi:RecB family exonuclease